MTYTQSPQLTSQEIKAFLEEAKTARFCSMNKDGTIHAAPVWFEYKNGQTLTATPEKIRKTRNVKRNKNVTVLVDVEVLRQGESLSTAMPSWNIWMILFNGRFRFLRNKCLQNKPRRLHRA